MVRSWLFGPGHSERILARVFDAGADEALLDLEDAVPPDRKRHARELVAEALASHPAWVRVNRPGTELCAADLSAVGGLARGLRLPKVESAADVAWVRERLGGHDLPLTATIESAPGVLAAREIAAAPGVTSLAFGNVDFGLELHVDPADDLATLHARSHLVLASRAAGIEPPSDGVWVRYRDLDGLRDEARRARRIGFFGKSAIHPGQVPVINEVFSPTERELAWARRVLAAFEASGGAATRLDDGEMVDVPVAERARRIQRLAAVTGPWNRDAAAPDSSDQ
jgi:citrate lyase subunit beta/citryl-CoA lyase